MKKLALLSAAVTVIASQAAVAAVALDPQAVDAEPFRFIPTLVVEAKQDSNIYSSSANEVSSAILLVSPTFDLVAQDRNNAYAIRYGIRAGFYGESNNNYVDHLFSLNGHVEPNDRFRFNLGASYNFLHDDLGMGSTENTPLKCSPPAVTVCLENSDPDEYKVAGLNGGFEYGAKEAAGQIGFTTGYNQKRYDSAAVAIDRDLDTLNTQLEFRFRVMPKTRMLLDLEYNKGDYENAVTAANSDYTEKNYLLGVAWESTASTTGKVRIGNSKRETPSYSKTKAMWDVGVLWSPLERDQFTFNAAQRFQDGNNASTIDSQNFSASWSHEWLARLQSSLSLGLLKEDYVGQLRNDDTTSIGVALNYQMRRWLVLGGGVALKDRDSSINSFDYDRTVFSLNAQISL